MSKSVWLQQKILAYAFTRAAIPSSPVTWYVALFKTLPTESSDSGVEVSGGSYARKSVTNDTTNFITAVQIGSTAQTSNKLVITFPTATAGWGSVVGFGLYDASSGGNLWYWGAANNSQTVASGKTLTIQVGSMVITET